MTGIVKFLEKVNINFKIGIDTLLDPVLILPCYI